MSANLEFKIKGDGSQAVAESERVKKKITADTNVIKGDFGKMGAAINKEMAGVIQDLNGGTGAIGRIVSALGPAGLAIGATTGLAVGASAAILHMTSAAAEAGEKFTDLSGKTGLSVETLSGLELQLKQSESSLDAFANAMFFLTKNQAAAKEGNDALAAAFKKLGVDLNAGPEEAIRQTVRGLSNLTDVGERNRLGALTLGRGYKELSIFINDTGGDLDKLIETSRKAGRVMTAEAAKGAAQYKDNLDELSAQIDAVERNLGNDFVPAVSRAMKNIADLLKGNSGDWRAWAASVIDAFEIVNPGARGMGGESLAFLLGGGSLSGFEAVARARAAAAKAGKTDPGWGSKDNVLKTGGTLTVPEGLQYKPKISDADLMGDAKKRAEQAREAAEKEAEAARKKGFNEAERETERQAGVVKKLADEYAKLASQIEHFNDSQVEQQIATNRLDSGVETLTGEYRKQAEVLLAINAQEMRTLDAKERIKEAQEKAKKDEKELADIRADASDKVRAAIREELAILTDENTHLTEINNTIRRAEILGAIDARTAAWLRQLAVLNDVGKEIERIGITPDALAGLGDLTKPIPQGKGQQNGPFVDPKEFVGEFGEPPPPTFDLWKQSIKSLKDFSTGAFGGITQGLTQMVQAMLMGEKVSGKAFMSMAKSAIAGMAAQAAISALFQLAEGFAWLFINPPKAAAHFQSAAVFGIVAGMAGAASALIPGGGDASASAFGGGGSASSGGFGSGSQGTGPRIIEQPRNTLQQQVIVLRVESNDSHIVNVIHRDVQQNGSMRQLIVETAAG